MIKFSLLIEIRIFMKSKSGYVSIFPRIIGIQSRKDQQISGNLQNIS